MQTAEQIMRQQASVQTLSDIGFGDVRKPPELFKNLLLQKSIIMVSAEPFTGKSMFTLAAMIALDAGQPLMGTFAPVQHLRSLFIGQDSPLWDYAEQCRKLMVGYGLSKEARESLSSDLIINSGFDLGNREAVDFLSRWYDEVGFDVLIFDTLASTHTMDENSNTEMNFIMGKLKMLRQKFNCTIIFTHHDAKPSKDAERSAVYRPRGASIISGSVDIHISLRPGKDGSVRFTLPKGRGLSSNRKPVIYEMADCGTPDVPGIRFVLKSEAPGTANDILDYIVRATADGRNTSRQDLMNYQSARGANPNVVDGALAALERSQQIRKAGRGLWTSVAASATVVSPPSSSSPSSTPPI